MTYEGSKVKKMKFYYTVRSFNNDKDEVCVYTIVANKPTKVGGFLNSKNASAHYAVSEYVERKKLAKRLEFVCIQL